MVGDEIIANLLGGIYIKGIKQSRRLISTISNNEYPFDRIEEVAVNDETLEVFIPELNKARIKSGKYLWERYVDFLPFTRMSKEFSLGEGNTPLIQGNDYLQKFTGVKDLFLKNETQNPTWSFKDRGSLACIFMAKEMEEVVTATISTGNMGNSISAYGAKSGINVIVFVPEFTPIEKIKAMTIHGTKVIKVKAPDYSFMKKRILKLAKKLGLRIVSGNGPIRVEGYKLTAFELYEQMEGTVPDYITVPTSACGHIRGIFKGYRELKKAGFIDKLPKMIIVQAKNNSPIVSAIKEGKTQIQSFSNFTTIAEAITSGTPMGGNEIIHKAKEFNWLAEDVTEEEILESQKVLGKAGYFVEPAAATSVYAVKKLKQSGDIANDAKVLLMLTGSGLKDMEVFKEHSFDIMESNLHNIKVDLQQLLK
ncbi:threonine synthase [Selenihalanaerobacter shriftii]|uniref:Threonine synthase n=1 Tax=Selenihalanaerobacter shriftii TaxID=142842 RepID=A0A1T4QSP1_9FIRM|nr:threonine synthase [Selenihalanaerobacter shriftii]SKA06686.1 L-threonine synthase [Selenihalanaerobacter shriftii]